MSTEKGSAEELARLRRERDEADRLYNEALTKLDAAIMTPREFPHPPPGFDETQVTPLNERWELLSLKPEEGSGWFARVRTHAWSMVAPLFERQQAFNSALVDHTNRNIAMHRETVRALETTLAMLRDDHRRLTQFQTLLILYAQQITPYVDTKDRQVSGLLHGITAGVSAVSDELQKRWESMAARERRYEGQTAQMRDQIEDVRSTVGIMQRAVQSLKRELENQNSERLPVAGRAEPPQAPGGTEPSGQPSIDSYKYVGFEDRFRGSQSEIRERLAAYLPLFEGASDVLDVGCGRGEFLDLLREHGVSAQGIDLNEEMAALSRDRGLKATAADALTFVLAQPDSSLGGIFAAQVVEHLQPDYLMRFLDAAYHKLRPGSKIVLETINAACWSAFFSSYIRDLTHVKPLHPDTLKYLVEASGFQKAQIRYSAPVPDHAKLQSLPSTASSGVEFVLNENARRLNELLFTYFDYAVIGERL